MTKGVIFLLLVFIFLIPHVEAGDKKKTAVGVHGQLSIEGNCLVDKNGERFQLRGMSLFWSQWMPQYYNKETVDHLAGRWHCNVVRAAIGVEHDGYLENPEEEFSKAEAVVDAAIMTGIYVIVDWHDHHGEDHQAEAVSFFTRLAKKYGDHPNIIYELYNEPLDVSWSEVLKPYHEKIINAIRQHDKDNIIVCGTPNWSQDVDEAAKDPIAVENVAYTLHYYSGTHKQGLRDKAKYALASGLPLFVTEYGVTDANGDAEVIDIKEAQRWWDFLDDNQISYCNWSIADKDEASAALRPGTLPKEVNKQKNLTSSGKMVRDKLRSMSSF